MNISCISESISKEGYAIVENVFSQGEIDRIVSAIMKVEKEKPAFRKTKDLFAIRRFLKEVPTSVELLFNKNFSELVFHLFGDGYFVVKSIYFDKPERSNWFVSYHQDLTISVDRKASIEGFQNWTVKQSQYAVQPPLEVLRDNFTLRIHLDDTDEDNGALKIIPGSHQKGIYRPETIDWKTETEKVCSVQKGGVMIMKPLLLHSSNRTLNNKRRRVIHLEFSRSILPGELNWAEVVKRKVH